ncbi:glycolate oxidase subunit GlcE [Lacisediminimonas sp.]|uniref:glycolate oxidase subunit GlcE n=1 Tax=Lacisediminimonas sp. TaxID=3060582 RepID=UPI002721018A|nr:glycolate oxidase subunit GlcE [Lacisediminimonas sp.]MDO8299811.1 glycolate oxidase subunit GlcE [Lacisediminimonas sp.]
MEQEQVLQDFGQRIRAAVAARQPLQIRGGGSKDWYGQVPAGEVLDTRAWSGIVDYDPTELVVTARCGTPLAELEAVLAAQNQMLAFEPPHFGAGATVGGMVAAGLSGPRRQAVGAVRDFVLGATIMDGRGQLLRFGGRVMKNVAGYDVSRLMAGAMGSLGLILEVSLKVLPRPFIETTIRLDAGQAGAIRSLNQWGGQPLPISASMWHGERLLVRLAGARSAVHAAQGMMGGAVVEDAGMLWQQIREQQHPFFTAQPETPCWRLSVPSVTDTLALPGEQMIEWGGALRWLRTDADAASVRQAAAAAGGHATLFRGGDKEDGVFHPLAPAVAAIQRKLKQGFDPDAIFNPGRLYNDF